MNHFDDLSPDDDTRPDPYEAVNDRADSLGAEVASLVGVGPDDIRHLPLAGKRFTWSRSTPAGYAALYLQVDPFDTSLDLKTSDPGLFPDLCRMFARNNDQHEPSMSTTITTKSTWKDKANPSTTVEILLVDEQHVTIRIAENHTARMVIRDFLDRYEPEAR